MPEPDLILHLPAPLNAEPPLAALGRAFLTPTPCFYIRCHGTIPALDAATHRIRLDGLVARPLALACGELAARFARRSVTAALACAGNRRLELDQFRPVSGVKWRAGAVGNAAWSGVALADVLRAAGLDAAAGRALHVAFAAADVVEMDGRRFTYGASIPLAKALSPEVLLADTMNGAPLAPEHGAPWRVVVPGYVGVRSVKWLAAIRVQDAPSDNYFQRRDYKLFPPETDPETADDAAGTMLYELPVNAAICAPEDGARLPAGPVMLRGYAVAGERGIARVEVTADDGATWTRAATEPGGVAPWAWTVWTARLALPPGAHPLAVRATDAAGRTQPAELGEVWNVKGYVNNAWHRVRIRLG
jgi:sulfite oxidase